MTDHELTALVDKYIDWQSVPGKMFWKAMSCRRIRNGTEAGTIADHRGHKRCHIAIGQKRYLRSRLVFLMYYGYLPKFIDHRDCNTANDHPSNLRAATHSQNLMNHSKNQNNKSGFKGVFWNTQKNRWHARIGANRQDYHLGLFDTKESAASAYRKAAQKLHKEFAYGAGVVRDVTD